MRSLDRLEAERGGCFKIRLEDGEIVELPSPLDLSWGTVAALSTYEVTLFAQFVPGAPRIPLWKLDALRAAWIAHHGLLDIDGARRLFYYVERYAEAIEADLMHVPGLPPLAEMWQTRQWRRLLLAIDHLPRNSAFVAAVASDEEHARMVIEAQVSTQVKAEPMPFHEISPEVSVLMDVADWMQRVMLTIVQANSKKGAQTSGFTPYPRPEPATARIREQVRFEKHQRLAARVLGRPLPPE